MSTPATQPDAEALATLVIATLDAGKALDIRQLDVRGITSITDIMVIASGSVDRHVKALADAVIEGAKQAGVRPLGSEGEQGGEWILIDLGDVVVHVMNPRTREFYNLEKLWDPSLGGPGAVDDEA